MILPFQNQFEPLIHGSKIHTIRTDEKDRWKPGMKIHMCVNNRTKNMRVFKVAECVSVQTVRLYFYQHVIGVRFFAMVDGHVVSPKRLATNDGLSMIDFCNWFYPLACKQNPKELIYTGKIIHWTDYKY